MDITAESNDLTLGKRITIAVSRNPTPLPQTEIKKRVRKIAIKNGISEDQFLSAVSYVALIALSDPDTIRTAKGILVLGKYTKQCIAEVAANMCNAIGVPLVRNRQALVEWSIECLAGNVENALEHFYAFA